MVQIEKSLGVEFNYVNVSGGGVAKLKSLLGKFTDVAILGKGKFAGREELLPLSVLADKRSASQANVASAGENNYVARFQLSFWWMMENIDDWSGALLLN